MEIRLDVPWYVTDIATEARDRIPENKNLPNRKGQKGDLNHRIGAQILSEKRLQKCLDKGDNNLIAGKKGGKRTT